MKLSRTWLHEEYVDLSHISDEVFIEKLTAFGLRVKVCQSRSHDTIVEFDIPSHRPDCNCIIGLAREIAAAFGKPMRHHEPVVKGCEDCSIYELLDVDVPADELCNRYTCRMVRNVKIAPSPPWLSRRLLACGIQSVNNIVDICRLVMLECGQPIVAYDYRSFSSGSLIVRQAEDGELLTTQDGNIKQLEPGTPVIADECGPIGLAGITGIKIPDDTTTVVFEAASYSNNADAMLTIPALQRACELVELLGCGEVLDGILDILNYVPEPRTLELDSERINQLLGINLSHAEMVSCLNRLEIPVEGSTIYIPSFRTDLNCLGDIAAEVGRCTRG